MEREMSLKPENLIKKNCSFCNPNLEKHPHFQEFGLPPNISSYPILQTDFFRVKPDILPVNPDGFHLLLVPRSHILNTTELPEESYREIYELMKRIQELIGPYVIFEHGAIKEGSNHQSVYHAHVHLIGGIECYDVSRYLQDVLQGGLDQDEKYSYQVIGTPSLVFPENIRKLFGGEAPCPYLYFQQGRQGLIVLDPENKMKSQVTQRAMSRFSGQQLDWKQIVNGGEEEKIESARRIRSLLDYLIDKI